MTTQTIIARTISGTPGLPKKSQVFQDYSRSSRFSRLPMKFQVLHDTCNEPCCYFYNLLLDWNFWHIWSIQFRIEKCYFGAEGKFSGQIPISYENTDNNSRTISGIPRLPKKFQVFQDYPRSSRFYRTSQETPVFTWHTFEPCYYLL